jgi:organic radical activating enzyme
MRQFAKHKFKDIYYTLDYINDSYKNLQVFDLKLGNACNLSCRICNRTSSSAIAEQEYTTGVISIAELHELKQTVNWADTDIFWNQMLDTVQNLKYLDLYGGEPLISRSHFNFLRKLIDLDVAKDIKIDYNTNGTVFSKKFFDLWDNFKEIKLSFSIDDIGLRFEQQRCGASWLTVCENINKFNQHRSNKFITEVFPTINTQNVFWIPELIAWINTQEFDYVGFNVLTTPIEFDIQNMNYKDKQKIIDKLQQYVNQHPIITSIIQLLSN